MVRRWRIASGVALALACGPTGGSAEATAGSETTADTLAGSTGEVPTTGEPACAGVALPQALPVGVQEVFWGDAVSTQIDVHCLYTSGWCSPEDPPSPCELEQPFGFVVVLNGDNAAPGVHPVTDGAPAGGAVIARTRAALIEGACEFWFEPFFADGEVEVLVNDGTCVAIDVRGVTPYVHASGVVDPNGSVVAGRCG
jgi:hypothetical protein